LIHANIVSGLKNGRTPIKVIINLIPIQMEVFMVANLIIETTIGTTKVCLTLAEAMEHQVELKLAKAIGIKINLPLKSVVKLVTLLSITIIGIIKSIRVTLKPIIFSFNPVDMILLRLLLLQLPPHHCS